MTQRHFSGRSLMRMQSVDMGLENNFSRNIIYNEHTDEKRLSDV